MSFPKFSTAARLVMLLGAAALGLVLARSPLWGAEAPVLIAPPAVDNPKSAGPLQTAVLAGGCFWGVQGVFEHARGVQKVVAGYAGGEKSTAQYETVSSGSTGHAESVKITFDPAAISYGQILQIAFSVVHDPTQLNRQGPDVGTQYRSAIFYVDEDQKRIAQAYIAQLDQSHSFARADRDARGAAQGILCGGGLSPGLPVSQSDAALHCHVRLAQDREFQAHFSGALQWAAGAGA